MGIGGAAAGGGAAAEVVTSVPGGGSNSVRRCLSAASAALDAAGCGVRCRSDALVAAPWLLGVPSALGRNGVTVPPRETGVVAREAIAPALEAVCSVGVRTLELRSARSRAVTSSCWAAARLMSRAAVAAALCASLMVADSSASDECPSGSFPESLHRVLAGVCAITSRNPVRRSVAATPA